MSTIKVNVKWGKEKFSGVELDLSEPPSVFKAQLYTLTGVLPERMKVMGVKGGMLKDEGDWKALGVKEGHNFMLIGTAEAVPDGPSKPVVFVEDLNPHQAALAASDVVQPAGLSNLGNTCYMNSTLQMLRAVPELNQELKRFAGTLQDMDPRTTVTASLRDLFSLLDGSVNKAIPPFVFLQMFRTAFPQFAQQARGQYMQQDAEECLSQLLTTLSQKLVKGEENVIDRLMGGEMEETLACVEPEGEGPVSKPTPFRRLTCHIGANTSHMLEGIKDSLEEVIEKNSSKLGRQSQFKKTQLISRLPPYLAVQFVRFYWKPKEQVRCKILKPVQFPLTLDVHPLCTKELQQKLAPKRTELRDAEDAVQAAKKMKKFDDADKDKKDKDGDVQMGAQATEGILDNEHGFYELCAVVTHQGRTAEGGHYVAWVLQDDGKWLKFDDDKVSEVTEDEVKKLHGGGDWHIAYLSLYRTKKIPKVPGQASSSSSGGAGTSTGKEDMDIYS